MQSHHNAVAGENDESLVTLKTCDKTETQATKKHVFHWRKKKILLFLKKHLSYKYFNQFFTDNLLKLVVEILIYLAPKNLVKASILLLIKCQHLLECKS